MSRTFELSGESQSGSSHVASRRVAAFAAAAIAVIAALYWYFPRSNASEFDQACLSLDQSAHDTLVQTNSAINGLRPLIMWAAKVVV